jgi:glycerol uptake facilitator-like aquaporin
MTFKLSQQALAEGLGTAALLAAVVGSGIMAQRLAGGNAALALLANTLATGLALLVLIELLGPVSGAHFNPLVTLSVWYFSKQKTALTFVNPAHVAIIFIVCQLLGAVAGTLLAHAMFDMPLLQTSPQLRGGWSAAGQFAGWGQWLAEAVATAGLLLCVHRAQFQRTSAAPATAVATPAASQPAAAPPTGVPSSVIIASYIGAAYWFTASTSFANPAAVLGRMLTPSFAGIAPASAPGFVAAQCAGAVLAVGLIKLLQK